jgi:hypothetical protein
MAAILRDHGSLTSELAVACEVATGDAADFLNACAEIGILETRAGSARGPAPEDSKKTAAKDAWRNVVGSLKRQDPE